MTDPKDVIKRTRNPIDYASLMAFNKSASYEEMSDSLADCLLRIEDARNEVLRLVRSDGACEDIAEQMAFTLVPALSLGMSSYVSVADQAFSALYEAGDVKWSEIGENVALLVLSWIDISMRTSDALMAMIAMSAHVGVAPNGAVRPS